MNFNKGNKMKVIVEYVSLGRGPGYYRIYLKIGNYVLEVTDSSDYLDNENKAQKIADKINKKIKKMEKKIIHDFIIDHNIYLKY